METIEVNGTIIKINTVNGMIAVNIETENADVIVNERRLWSKFDQEEYVLIPENMREFIKSIALEIRFHGSKKNEVSAYCYCPDVKSEPTFYFNENQREPIHVRFDYIDSLEYLRIEYFEKKFEPKVASKIFADFKKLDTQIKEIAEKYGFQWKYSHSKQYGMFGWWDIVVTAENWNEKGFVECWRLIERVMIDLDLIMNDE